MLKYRYVDIINITRILKINIHGSIYRYTVYPTSLFAISITIYQKNLHNHIFRKTDREKDFLRKQYLHNIIEISYINILDVDIFDIGI